MSLAIADTGLPPDDDEVRTAANYRCFRFESACDAEKDLASLRITPAFGEIGKDPAWAFNAIHSFDIKAGVVDFASQIFRSVEVGGGEVIETFRRVPMISVAEITLDDGGKIAIA